MRKLIRDKLDTVIDDDRLEFTQSIEEYDIMLRDKLYEELEELENSDYKDVDEYADVLEVLYALAKFYNIDKDDINARRIEKLYERGGFERGLILNDNED